MFLKLCRFLLGKYIMKELTRCLCKYWIAEWKFNACEKTHERMKFMTPIKKGLQHYGESGEGIRPHIVDRKRREKFHKGRLRSRSGNYGQHFQCCNHNSVWFVLEAETMNGGSCIPWKQGPFLGKLNFCWLVFLTNRSTGHIS